MRAARADVRRCGILCAQLSETCAGRAPRLRRVFDRPAARGTRGVRWPRTRPVAVGGGTARQPGPGRASRGGPFYSVTYSVNAQTRDETGKKCCPLIILAIATGDTVLSAYTVILRTAVVSRACTVVAVSAHDTVLYVVVELV